MERYWFEDGRPLSSPRLTSAEACLRGRCIRIQSWPLVLVGTEKHLFHLEEAQLCVQQDNEVSRKGEIGNCIGEAKSH
jgi:hypothetical protein